MIIFELSNIKNGIMLKAKLQEDGEEVIVYQESYHDDEDLERFADFLKVIDDSCGPTRDKYSDERIAITIEPGHKSKAAEKLYEKEVQTIRKILQTFVIQKKKGKHGTYKEWAEKILWELDCLKM